MTKLEIYQKILSYFWTPDNLDLDGGNTRIMFDYTAPRTLKKVDGISYRNIVSVCILENGHIGFELLSDSDDPDDWFDCDAEFVDIFDVGSKTRNKILETFFNEN